MASESRPPTAEHVEKQAIRMTAVRLELAIGGAGDRKSRAGILIPRPRR
jgi:hypothetical protein